MKFSLFEDLKFYWLIEDYLKISGLIVSYNQMSKIKRIIFCGFETEQLVLKVVTLVVNLRNPTHKQA